MLSQTKKAQKYTIKLKWKQIIALRKSFSSFWNNLNFVVNAVDNVKARQYVDGQCVWF